jgi:hypothetical protein
LEFQICGVSHLFIKDDHICEATPNLLPCKFIVFTRPGFLPERKASHWKKLVKISRKYHDGQAAEEVR